VRACDFGGLVGCEVVCNTLAKRTGGLYSRIKWIQTAKITYLHGTRDANAVAVVQWDDFHAFSRCTQQHYTGYLSCVHAEMHGAANCSSDTQTPSRAQCPTSAFSVQHAHTCSHVQGASNAFSTDIRRGLPCGNCAATLCSRYCVPCKACCASLS